MDDPGVRQYILQSRVVLVDSTTDVQQDSKTLRSGAVGARDLHSGYDLEATLACCGVAMMRVLGGRGSVRGWSAAGRWELAAARYS